MYVFVDTLGKDWNRDIIDTGKVLIKLRLKQKLGYN